MLISLNWLKDYVDIPKSVTPEDLSLLLTTHTVEIECIERQGTGLDGVVVGEILEIKKHPNADKLSVAQIDVGEKKPRQIIFGKMLDMEVGLKVPVALAPTVLSGGLEIKKAKLRGETSEGMLCLDQEMGLLKDGVSMRFFDKKVKNGTPIVRALNLDDVIYELDNKSITHRPDLWSHYGLAREIAAFTGGKFKEYKADSKLLSKSESKIKLKGKIEDYDLCPRYMAIAMEGIIIEDSPKWMQDKLIAVGVRPISNIVDITNYVLLELGQPLHAFDAKLLGDKIVVRRAKNKEIMKTLDTEKRELDKNDIVITDGKNPVALGGIMGGLTSEINNETTSIVIESANFEPTTIRKTSTKLGLRSESSMRFEKGLDPNLSETALIRTVELVKKLCPKARVVSNLVDEKKFKLDQGPIELNLDWLEKKIGERIEDKKVVGILESLGFIVETRHASSIRVTVPTWRATGDILIPEDIVEEVVRIYGYDNIKPVMPKVNMESPEVNEERLFERKIKNILAGASVLTEVYNYSFVGEEQLKKLSIDFKNHIRLVNPIAEHQTMLRQSLIPNIINNIITNQAKYDEIGIFEIGSVYFNSDGEINKDESNEFLPYQEKHLSIVIAGVKNDKVFKKAKGVLEYLMGAINLSVNYEVSETKPNWSDEGYCASILVGGKSIGSINNLGNTSAGVKKKVSAIEISFKELFNLAKDKEVKKYKQLEKFPAAVRDLAFVVDVKIMYNDIKNEIAGFNELISEVELFDVYEGDKLGENKKSLAFHITYQADRTLTAEEVDGLQKGLIGKLEKKFNAKIRDF